MCGRGGGGARRRGDGGAPVEASGGLAHQPPQPGARGAPEGPGFVLGGDEVGRFLGVHLLRPALGVCSCSRERPSFVVREERASKGREMSLVSESGLHSGWVDGSVGAVFSAQKDLGGAGRKGDAKHREASAHRQDLPRRRRMFPVAKRKEERTRALALVDRRTQKSARMQMPYGRLACCQPKATLTSQTYPTPKRCVP